MVKEMVGAPRVTSKYSTSGLPVVRSTLCTQNTGSSVTSFPSLWLAASTLFNASAL
jgi:hypothetical protein